MAYFAPVPFDGKHTLALQGNGTIEKAETFAEGVSALEGAVPVHCGPAKDTYGADRQYPGSGIQGRFGLNSDPA